jgi:ABC-type sugar transport system substrate-binding protein
MARERVADFAKNLPGRDREMAKRMRVLVGVVSLALASSVGGGARAQDISKLKSPDGNPLVPKTIVTPVPERPKNPASFEETDARRWFDFEFPYANLDKVNIPKSPKDGPKGKKIIVIKNGDHPYHTAYNNGAVELGKAYGMTVEVMSPNWDSNVQTQMVDQAINARPDLIIYLPVDQQASTQHLRKINKAGIPVIGSNVMPSPDGMKYLLAFVGPADWGQARMLADTAAKAANYKGGYAVLTHAPGGSAYYARMHGYITELAKVAPNMKLLDVQSPGFEAEKVKQVVADWITRFGKDLNMILTSETTAQAIGSIDACENAKRTDILIAGIDNSAIALNYIKEGKLLACTNQPPMQDGASAVELAAKWFKGEKIPAVSFMAPGVIEKTNVDSYLPAQW